MSRKTFQIILVVVGLGILTAVLVPKILEFINQPDVEETIVGYSSGSEIAVVEEIIEEGQVTLGEVVQNYQILSVVVEQGDYAGQAFEIEYASDRL